jgi:putative AbiEi antitoxin of type IV toxin-antitoxin system
MVSQRSPHRLLRDNPRSYPSAASWPQAAAISCPRVSRTVQATPPSLTQRSNSRSTAFGAALTNDCARHKERRSLLQVVSFAVNRCNICCMEMVKALTLLGEYTAGQWGLVTTRQSVSLGVSDVTLHRLRAAGLLEKVRHSVHAVTSSPAPEARPEQAAWLSLRPGTPAWERPRLDPDGGVISHRSAARLHGLGDLPATDVEMTVPRRRTMRDPETRLHRGDLIDADVTVIEGLPVTTPVRTIRDLLAQRTDASHVATIIRQAALTGQVLLDELPDEIAPYARRYGVTAGDGSQLLVQLLAQIGVSLEQLATRSPDMTWGELDGRRWADLENRAVTWGQLANTAPELVRRLLAAAPDKDD